MRAVAGWLIAVLLMVALVPPLPASAQGGGAPNRAVIGIRDAETENLVRAIATPLFRAALIDPQLVRLNLIQDRAINAFVATGNLLFIHTGLLQQAGSSQELAGVLAHETGHITGAHLARLPEELRNALLRQVAAMLIGGAAGVAGRSSDLGLGVALGGMSASQGALFGFTRAMEQQADAAGLEYLERVGWSARGLERLLQRLLDQELLAAARQDPYFRTHPLSRDRLEFVREGIARSRHSDAAMPVALEARFAMMQAKLMGFIDGPNAVARRYPESDQSPAARYARAIALYRQGRIDPAVRMLDVLIREDPGSPWLQEMKGQALFEGGRPREALLAYREAARLAPGEALIRTGHAQVMVELAEPALLRAAVVELRASLALDRTQGFAWRQLGIAQGRLGDTGNADLALAEEAVLEADFAKARLLARRAEEALPPGPARLRAQDLRNAAQRDNLTPEQRADERRRREQQR